MKINAELFKLIRISRELSEAELANMAGVKQSVISKIENTGQIDGELLNKMSLILRYTTKFFQNEFLGECLIPEF